MFSQIQRHIVVQGLRSFSTSGKSNIKVTVCGAGGGIGQPLSLLLKQSPLVSDLRLFDIVGTLGVAADVSHIDTASKVTGYVGMEQLDCALQESEVVVIPAGVPRKPGMTRDDLINVNAGVIKDLATSIAKNCPKALVAIITNPVNTAVPIAAEIFKLHDTYDPKRLFGVSTLDVVRARQFIGEACNCNPQNVEIPIVGGHSGNTIIPLISQCVPKVSFSQEKIEALTVRIQEAGTEVVKAKAGKGSATLSMAYAGARFAISLMKGLSGESGVVECSYVESNVTDAPFFATPLLLGKCGIEKNLGLPEMNDYEKNLLATALPELKKNIDKGIEYVKGAKC